MSALSLPFSKPAHSEKGSCLGICFSSLKQRQKGRINDRAEKRPAPCWGEREGSNLIWLKEDVCYVGARTCVCAHMHGSAAQWEGTVGMGQEGCTIEWSLQSQKQWGVSPDALIPGRPLKEGLVQRRPFLISNSHSSAPTRTLGNNIAISVLHRSRQ